MYTRFIERISPITYIKQTSAITSTISVKPGYAFTAPSSRVIGDTGGVIVARRILRE